MQEHTLATDLVYTSNEHALVRWRSIDNTASNTVMKTKILREAQTPPCCLIGLTRAILLVLKPVTGMIECLRQLRALTATCCLACVPHPPSPCSAAWSTALPLGPVYRVLARAVIGLVRSSLQVDHGGSAFGNVFKFDAGHTAAVSSVFALTYILRYTSPLLCMSDYA